MDCILSPADLQDYEAWLDSLPPGWPDEPAEPEPIEIYSAPEWAAYEAGIKEGMARGFELAKDIFQSSASRAFECGQISGRDSAIRSLVPEAFA